MASNVLTTTSQSLTANTTTSTNGIKDSVLGASLLAINILIVVLNFLTIIVIIRFRTKNAVDVFVLTLATIDLIKGLIPVPMSTYIYMTDWHLEAGTFECNFFGWIAFATNSGPMLILTLMSMERFWAIVKPFSYKRHVTPRKVQIVSALAIVFSGIHSALPLFGVGRILPYNFGAYSHFDYSKYSKGTIIYSLFILCYGFGMILLVFVMYSFVFYKIRNLIHRHRRMSTFHRGGTSSSNRDLNLKTEQMFSYLTVALMVLFWFSWLPFLMVVAASQLDLKPPHDKLDLYAIRIAVVNSMLNPLACAALCKPYRRGILYYLRRLCSYAGFKRPDSDIWDPWKRRTASARSYRRTLGDQNDGTKGRTLSEYGQSSFTDSVVTTMNETDYGRHRIPSVLETYDAYRHKRQSIDNNIEDHYTDQTRLSIVKEGRSRSSSGYEDAVRSQLAADKEINGKQSILHRSLDSGIEGSPDTLHGIQVEVTFHQSCDSIKDEVHSTKDHNKNLTSKEPNYGQRRKIQLLDKVQKYLGTKREHADRRNSIEIANTETDTLLTSKETTIDSKISSKHSSTTDSNCFMEEQDSKIKNDLAESDVSTRLKPDELVDALNNIISQNSPKGRNTAHSTIELPQISVNTLDNEDENKRKSRSCSDIQELILSAGFNDRDSYIDARPISSFDDSNIPTVKTLTLENCDRLFGNKNIKNIELYNGDSKINSPPNGRLNDESDSNDDFFTLPTVRLRCSSEGSKDNLIAQHPRNDAVARELENSLRILNRITQELIDISDTSDTSDSSRYGVSLPLPTDRNTVCF